MRIVPGIASVLVTGAAIAGCGGDGAAAETGPTVVVSTGILGELVGELVGDDAAVDVLLPAGADPHELVLTPQQVAALTDADAVVVNGLGLEEGLADALDAATQAGVPVFDASTSIDVIDGNPHFVTDPERMRDVLDDLAPFLGDAVQGIAADELRAAAEEMDADLATLSADIDDVLDRVPDDRRGLVTTHDALRYFADRYRFEVLGTVIPAGSTLAEPSPADIADLASAMEDGGVDVIFTDASSEEAVAATVAAEVGADVELVPLFTESLGPDGSGAETYDGLMRTNAERIAEALS